jgi:hypothetical protein
MNGFTPAGNSGGAIAAPGPSTGFSVKPRSTAKSRHKDDRARVTAHARSVGRTGKAQGRELGELAAPLPPPEQEQVPLVPRREGRPDEAREHVRRDIGSHVAVFELGAPDNPEDLSAPYTDPRGAPMRWAARCLTHGQTRYYADHRRALQAVKGSHAWCEGCAAAVAGSRRIHNRARAQQRRTSP